MDGSRFVHLHSVSDITGEVGHSAYCDLFVRTVMRTQEGGLVPLQHRKYVGAGAEREKGRAQRKKRRKGDRHRERRSDDSDEVIDAVTSRRRPSSPARAGDTVEGNDDDEDAPIQPATTAGRKRRRLLVDEVDGEEQQKETSVVPLNPQLHKDEAALSESDELVALQPRQPRPAVTTFFAAFNGSVSGKGHVRNRPRDRWEEKESDVVDLVDEELNSSLPQASPPSELTDSVVIPRPPSPLLDLPREAIALPSVDAEDVDDSPFDPLMRRLSHFVLADRAVEDALDIPAEVWWYHTAHPPPSLTPPISLTPPQPAVSAVLPVVPQVTPPRVVPLVSSAPPAVLPMSPVSASVPASASSVSAVQGSEGGALTAAERKALAEAKRQQWLKAASRREEEERRGDPLPLPLPPPPSRSLPYSSAAAYPPPSVVSTPHTTRDGFSVPSASAPSAVSPLTGHGMRKERENGWRVGAGAQRPLPQSTSWR